MLTILMNYIFVLAIGIFTGILIASEVFQKQLDKVLREWDSQ